MNSKLRKIVSLVLALVFVCCCASATAEDAIQTILNAKTTQAFSQEPVSEEDMNTILAAGTSATSAINQQPWFFAVVTNQEIMDEIAGAGFGGAPAGGKPAGMPPEGAPGMGSMPAEGAMPPEGAPSIDALPQGVPGAGAGASKAALGDSPAAIIIYMHEGTASPNASFDCGLACQNMVIAANALGYGTKIVSSPTMSLNGENHDALCEKLGVDPAFSAVAVLLVGAVDAEVDGATGATTRSAIEEKVSFVK